MFSSCKDLEITLRTINRVQFQYSDSHARLILACFDISRHILYYYLQRPKNCINICVSHGKRKRVYLLIICFLNYLCGIQRRCTNSNSLNLIGRIPSEKLSGKDLTFWHRSFTFNSNKSPT